MFIVSLLICFVDHKFISMTRCLRIRDLEKAEDIVNMFGKKTESGVHDLV